MAYNINEVSETIFNQKKIAELVIAAGGIRTEQIGNEIIYYVNNVEVNRKPVETALSRKLAAITEFDSSPAVNEFSFNGISFWLDKATRVGLVNSTNMLKLAGEENTTLWLGNTSFTLPCDTALSILCRLEIYALQCYNVTAAHKANVEALTTDEEIEAYDFTTGYPEKLVF